MGALQEGNIILEKRLKVSVLTFGKMLIYGCEHGNANALKLLAVFT